MTFENAGKHGIKVPWYMPILLVLVAIGLLLELLIMGETL